jgi:tRNA threonylcarbamoyl adenosine modification protein YeaZ
MILLAIDTAAELCAACIFDTEANAENARAVLDIGKGHAEHIMAVIGGALDEAKLTYADLGAVTVSVGPGSFTGVRVGVSAARGFALALKIPAIGVSTLEALAVEARQLHPGRAVLAAIGTRPEHLYAAVYDAAGEAIVEPMAGSLDTIAAMTRDGMALCGSAAAMVAERAGAKDIVLGPASATADIAAYARLAAGKDMKGAPPRPLYLREPDAKPQAGFALPRRPGP